MIRRFQIVVLFLSLGIAVSSANAQIRKPPNPPKEVQEAIDEFDKAIERLNEQFGREEKRAKTTFEKTYDDRRMTLITKLESAKDGALEAKNLPLANAFQAIIDFYKLQTPPAKRLETKKTDDREEIIATLKKENASMKKLEAEIRELKALQKVNVPPDAVQYKSHYYLRVDKPTTYHIALKVAQSAGGHLARIEDKEEHAFVFDLVKSGRQPWYILDGSDEETERLWRWSNESRVTYLDWDVMEPSGDGRVRQHDLLINAKNGKMHDGVCGERDGVCGERDGFIIEWDSK